MALRNGLLIFWLLSCSLSDRNGQLVRPSLHRTNSNAMRLTFWFLLLSVFMALRDFHLASV